MARDTISVKSEEALKAVNGMLATIEGDIALFTENYATIANLLQKSQGDFTDALKEQLGEEKKAMEASIALMKSMCKALQSAVDRFMQADGANQ